MLEDGLAYGIAIVRLSEFLERPLGRVWECLEDLSEGVGGGSRGLGLCGVFVSDDDEVGLSFFLSAAAA